MVAGDDDPAEHQFSSNMSAYSFREMVKKAKEYILAGDIIQVVLSQRFHTKTDLSPFRIYRALRHINPSPYLFYLKQGDLVQIGSSPEILVRLEEGEIELRPIAGTRRRGKTPAEDLALEKELLADPKERAEHLMLVDLGRNDVGRVSVHGQVETRDLMLIERYSHVMHIVSGVHGRLAPGYDQFDVLRACFPAGTVSGAPKIRAMEIIEELEPERRGPYAGAVGYFGFSGNMDFCITIRTFIQQGRDLWVQAGAGIVADSDPQAEYEETIAKSMGLRRALDLASKWQ
jgi:anthranilate synthase component 1